MCHNVDNIQIHNQRLTKKLQFFLHHGYGSTLLSKVNSTVVLAVGIMFLRKNKWSLRTTKSKGCLSFLIKYVISEKDSLRNETYIRFQHFQCSAEF